MSVGAETGKAGAGEPSYRDALAVQKAETRRRILAASRRVFLREGYLDANLNEIAALAGVGKGTLYRHFENKGELYVAMLAENGAAFTDGLRGAIDPHAPVAKQLAQLAEHYLTFWLEHPDHFQIIWAIHNRQLIGPLSADLSRHVGDIFERPLRLLEQLIRTGMERKELHPCDAWNVANATALGANAIIGQIVMGTPQVVERDLQAVYREFYRVVIAGLAVPGGPPS